MWEGRAEPCPYRVGMQKGDTEETKGRYKGKREKKKEKRNRRHRQS